MSDDPDLTRGLYGKFLVQRTDGDPTGRHTDCRYFVLDPEHDAAAMTALIAYAAEVRHLGYAPLADDLDRWIDEILAGNPPTAAPTGG